MKIEYIIFADGYVFSSLVLNNTLFFIICNFTMIYRNHPEIDELFEFLKKQELTVAAAAYTVMICGLVKHLNVR